ncbi:MAG TPA: hypothetical protein VFS39_18490 [Nitrospira sp.]|nr:hypothetical protein [Nitrospira sp.]
MAAQRRAWTRSTVLLGPLMAVTIFAAVQGMIARAAAGDPASNPHSDLIFRATGARACSDCHGIGKSGALLPQPLDNDLVRKLRDKAKGVHGPGRFADCLRCHAGGSKGVEKY